jgi:hypothetical protein
MPFVQDAVKVALERYRFDREALALGCESMGDADKAEKYRQPVAFGQLLDDEKRAIEEGFKQDETGVFEEIERDAAEIGEWLKEFRHPRDAERFRESIKFVGSDMMVWPVLGVEVRPGVFSLDLSIWKAEVAKPICNFLRRLADEKATEPAPDLLSGKGVSLQAIALHIRKDDPDGQKQLVKKWQNRRTAKTNPLPRPIGTEAGEFAHPQRLLYKPAELLDFLKKSEGEAVVQDFNLKRVIYACLRDATPFPPCSDDNPKTPLKPR